jgi:ABC-type Zn uptake system ZnuABC Zn-binding protein ZnuA
VADAGGSARVVLLGEDLPGVEYDDGNPHLWLDVAYARRYVGRIAETLAGLDPADAAGYAERAAAYDRELADLDSSIRTRFEAVPAESRRVVSFHDAFPYFASAYGLEVIGVVVEAPGQDPSAGEVAALIDAIRTTGAGAILAEVQFNDRLARQIAAETGATVVDDLYTDSLGDPPIDSYAALMRRDADLILEALR